MPDPIWLDANIVILALKGHADVNEQLSAFRKAGRPLLIVTATKDEVTKGNPLTENKSKSSELQRPSPEQRVRTEIGLKKIGIEEDISFRKIPPHKLAEYIAIAEKNAGKVKMVSESDRKMYGQIKASAEARGVRSPQVVTEEGPKRSMQNQAKSLWGIEVVPRNSQAGVAPVNSKRRVELANYPSDPPESSEKQRSLSRFFRDRPVLKKLGLMGASMAASAISSATLDAIKKHYEGVVAQAQKELSARYPDIMSLERTANLGGHKKAYDAAISKLRAPSNAQAAAAVIVALTPDKDRPQVYKDLQNRLSKVKLADGALGGYAQAATAYLNAMADLYAKISDLEKGLPQAGADIRMRGAFLRARGDDLVDAYFAYAPLSLASPVTYYEWMGVHTVGSIFQALGDKVLGLAVNIEGRVSAYDRAKNDLDKELIRLSNELGKYNP